MPVAKYILKEPDGAAYEVTMADIHLYFRKGDIARDWLARKEGEVRWHQVGALLEHGVADATVEPGEPFFPPPPTSAWSALPTTAATLAMFQAEAVASPSSVIDRLERIALPLKVGGTLAGFGLGASVVAGSGRTWLTVIGALAGGGLGFFAGYLGALAAAWAGQMLALQEKMAGKNGDE